MKIFEGIAKLTKTQKICLSGLIIAMVTILQKVVAINYIAAIPFFRVSFGGPALIIFASIFLGPFWGAIIGFSSDFIGYFIFDASSIVYKPQIGLIYLVLGFVSYYIFNINTKIKKEKNLSIIELITFSALFVIITLYLILNPDIDLVWKITIPIILAVLFGGLIAFVKLYKPHSECKYSTACISFTAFVVDVLVLVLFGSLMKTWAFSIYYDDPMKLWGIVFITQGSVMFFNVVFNTIVISLFLRVTKKYIH